MSMMCSQSNVASASGHKQRGPASRSVASLTTATHRAAAPIETISLEKSLYQELVLPIESESAPILFGWWPRGEQWDIKDLTERTTRCIPGVRPSVDVVALPKGVGLEAHWQRYRKAMSLEAWQAVFFESRAPAAALQEVCALLPEQVPLVTCLFYPMYVTAEMQEWASRLGFAAVLGDPMEHSLGELANAKAWLHPHIDPVRRSSNLRDAVPSEVARGPYGYIASSQADLCAAFLALQAEVPGAKFVLKPSWASGGAGIVLDVSEADLEAFQFPEAAGHTAILEEMIEGLGELQSPTLYMIGGAPCGLLGDQILADGGITNLGNRWPSDQSSEHLTQRCVLAAQALQQHWQMTSNWGLDFVIDCKGQPVIVDLNLGRPNGNFAVRLWESTFAQQLFLHSSSFVAADVSCDALFDALERQDLLWCPNRLEGVVVYQFLPGQMSSFAVASAAGWGRVEDILLCFNNTLQRASLS